MSYQMKAFIALFASLAACYFSFVLALSGVQ